MSPKAQATSRSDVGSAGEALDGSNGFATELLEDAPVMSDGAAMFVECESQVTSDTVSRGFGSREFVDEELGILVDIAVEASAGSIGWGSSIERAKVASALLLLPAPTESCNPESLDTCDSCTAAGATSTPLPAALLESSFSLTLKMGCSKQNLFKHTYLRAKQPPERDIAREKSACIR